MFSLAVMKVILDDHKSNMYHSSICYELQKSIQDETEKFLIYTREQSAKSVTEMLEACETTKKCVESLPFDYEVIGKERYAITWNIMNGYEGYVAYRDEFLTMSEENAQYVEKLYKIFDIQEDLSHYALRLTEATLQQSNEKYEVQEPYFKILPMIWFVVFASSVTLFLLLFHRFTRDLVDPLILMAKDSREMTKHNFQTPDFETDREDEMGELVHAFNKMKVAMRDYIHTMQKLHEEKMKNLEKEKRLEGARLEILKSQVFRSILGKNEIAEYASMDEYQQESLTLDIIKEKGIDNVSVQRFIDFYLNRGLSEVNYGRDSQLIDAILLNISSMLGVGYGKEVSVEYESTRLAEICDIFDDNYSMVDENRKPAILSALAIDNYISDLYK
jgi:hypothetical protein